MSRVNSVAAPPGASIASPKTGVSVLVSELSVEGSRRAFSVTPFPLMESLATYIQRMNRFDLILRHIVFFLFPVPFLRMRPPVF